MAYSKDYKECAVEYKRNHHTFEETQEIFGMAKSTFYEWEKEYNAEFPEKPKRTCEKKINKEALKRAVEERPDSELSELAEPFGCSPQAVFYALRRMGITLKKRRLPTQKNQKSSGENI
jgi:transposase